MPIKKRSSAPAEQPTLLDEVAAVPKEKKSVEAGGRIVDVYGENPDAAHIRRIGLVAMACGDDRPDQRFTMDDRLTALRTPFDSRNSQEIRYRNRIKNRATAITAMCIVCQGGRKGVAECTAIECPLWPFRLGGDPFRGKRA
jgi:hypothetical protein